MKIYLLRICLLFLLILGFIKCSDDMDDIGATTEATEALLSSADGDRGTVGSGDGKQGEPQAGLITAGEWNDIDHWNFWKTLIEKDTFGQYLDYWEMYPQENGYNLKVLNQFNLPGIDQEVSIAQGNNEIWHAKTDNNGEVALWSDYFNESSTFQQEFTLNINNVEVSNSVKVGAIGQPETIKVNIDRPERIPQTADVLFVVDATGSMGDELEFLKTELEDVIQRVQSGNSNLEIKSGAVFYRDQGDAYVTRTSPMTDNPSVTLNFIKNQSAGGGGDWPEAVHTAMEVATNQINWSEDARTRLLFLLLDAPPHHLPHVIESMQGSIIKAASMGIKIIPIAASGIDVSTEFLLRFMAIATNGTYVFITDDSGIGNDHLEPTVGEYEVEFLNDLMVRLIKKYAN